MHYEIFPYFLHHKFWFEVTQHLAGTSFLAKKNFQLCMNWELHPSRCCSLKRRLFAAKLCRRIFRKIRLVRVSCLFETQMRTRSRVFVRVSSCKRLKFCLKAETILQMKCFSDVTNSQMFRNVRLAKNFLNVIKNKNSNSRNFSSWVRKLDSQTTPDIFWKKKFFFLCWKCSIVQEYTATQWFFEFNCIHEHVFTQFWLLYPVTLFSKNA